MNCRSTVVSYHRLRRSAGGRCCQSQPPHKRFFRRASTRRRRSFVRAARNLDCGLSFTIRRHHTLELVLLCTVHAEAISAETHAVVVVQIVCDSFYFTAGIPDMPELVRPSLRFLGGQDYSLAMLHPYNLLHKGPAMRRKVFLCAGL